MTWVDIAVGFITWDLVGIIAGLCAAEIVKELRVKLFLKALKTATDCAEIGDKFFITPEQKEMIEFSEYFLPKLFFTYNTLKNIREPGFIGTFNGRFVIVEWRDN